MIDLSGSKASKAKLKKVQSGVSQSPPDAKVLLSLWFLLPPDAKVFLSLWILFLGNEHTDSLVFAVEL
jgi:hypothetical protein